MGQRTTHAQPHLVLVPPATEREGESVTGAQFCARVKAARERRGVTLASIAESTKISAWLLEAFERGDVSRWPKGIFRRSYFRDYVAACGLPVEEALREFLEHFPGEGDVFSGEDVRNKPRVTLAARLRSWVRRR